MESQSKLQDGPQSETAHKEGKTEEETIKFLSLFRFADKIDIVLMVVGSICSILMGGAFPLFSLLWGNMTDTFSSNDKMVDSAR